MFFIQGKPAKGQCYSLKVWVAPKFPCQCHNCQVDDIMRWEPLGVDYAMRAEAT